MKKIFAFIAIALIMSMVTTTVTAQVKLKPNQFAYVYTGVSVDSVSVNDTVFAKEIFVNKPTTLYYNVSVKITEIASASCTISLQGKIFSDDVYTNITTATYSGGGSDTTVIFTQNTTKQFYRYYRVRIVYGSGKVAVYNIKCYFKQ